MVKIDWETSNINGKYGRKIKGKKENNGVLDLQVFFQFVLEYLDPVVVPFFSF
jgi:hypothetical protein